MNRQTGTWSLLIGITVAFSGCSAAGPQRPAAAPTERSTGLPDRPLGMGGELIAERDPPPADARPAAHSVRLVETGSPDRPQALIEPTGSPPSQSSTKRPTATCSVRVDRSGDRMTIRPIVRAARALTASYHLVVGEEGRSGRSDIRLGGQFSGEGDETVILSGSTLTVEPERRLSIRLSVMWKGQEICRQVISGSDISSLQ